MTSKPHTTVHRRAVSASAERVYPLVADASLWPAVFAPSVALRHIEKNGNEERFQIWALVNGAVSTWTSHRVLNRDGLRVAFRQERSRPPVASMSGSWTIRPLGPERSEIELRHAFVLDGPVGSHAAFRRAVDQNSLRELAALARVAELGDALDEALFSFEDAVTAQAPAGAVYDFVARADAWPEHLPHVRRVTLREDPAGIQDLEMETATSDGSSHVTRSHRVCEEPSWIAYKQVVLPDLLWGHSGVWSFEDRGDGWSTAVSRHTVLLNPDAAVRAFGPSTSLAEARDRVRTLLGNNSGTTLRAAVDRAARVGTPPVARSGR